MERNWGRKHSGRAVGFHGEHGAGGEVRAHADHVFRRHAALAQHGGDHGIEHVQIILGVLQRPVLAQGRSVAQGGVHDGVGIVHGAFGHNLAAVAAHQDCPAGQGAVSMPRYIYS